MMILWCMLYGYMGTLIKTRAKHAHKHYNAILFVIMVSMLHSVIIYSDITKTLHTV